MTLHDDLVAAKALIADEANWWKGGIYNSGGECAATACQSATKTLTGERVFAMTRALDAQLPESWTGHRSVIDYNDHYSTSHADVIALFDRAIASALHSTEGERK